MKKICSVIILFFMFNPLLAQNNNQLNDMIIECLDSCTSHFKTITKRMYKYKDFKSYVCKDGLPLDFPYDSLPNYTFFSVDNFQVYSNPIRKYLRKGLSVYFVFFYLNDNKLLIQIAPRGVKRTSKKQVRQLISDWENYYYEFSCEQQKWILKKFEPQGI